MTDFILTMGDEPYFHDEGNDICTVGIDVYTKSTKNNHAHAIEINIHQDHLDSKIAIALVTKLRDLILTTCSLHQAISE